MLKNNGSTRDTIAAGISIFTDSVMNFSFFAVPIFYRDYVNQPDTCLIIMQSSWGINDPNMAVGSALRVDSLNFSGYVGVNELKNSIVSVNVYPSPANDKLTLDVELKNNIALSYQIFDLKGTLVRMAQMVSTKETIDVSSLSEGKYLIKLGDSKNNLLYTKGFSISR